MKFKLPDINTKLLPLKAHYFLFNAGTGSIVPFMSVFARQLGFSSTTVGVIYTVSPFVSMLSKPTMGAFSDRFQCKKIVMQASILLTALTFFLLIFAPSVPTTQKMRFSCNDSISTLDTCVGNFTLNDECSVESITSQTDNQTVTCKMNCEMNSSNWNTVCNKWNLTTTNYCKNITNHKTLLQFTANVPSNSLEMIKECVYFYVDSISLEDDLFVPRCPFGYEMDSICDIECDASTFNELVTNPTLSDQEIYGYYAFWFVTIIYVLTWITQGVVVPNSDSICFELLGNEPHKYGYQRCFGAVGWGTFTLFCGFLVDTFSQDSRKKNYDPAIYTAIVMLMLNFLSSCFIKYKQKKKTSNVVKDASKLLVNVRFMVFSFYCIFMGICTSLVWNFLFWVVEDLAAVQGCQSNDWIKTLQGFMQIIQCLAGEFPLFFLSGWILKKIGHINCMTLITFVFGVRLTLYSLIKNPWWFLPVEILNGFTYGLFWTTTASYATLIAPPGTETTVLGVQGAIFEGIGVSLGSLIAGILIDAYGGPMTFGIIGIACFIVTIIHGFVQYVLERFFNLNPLSFNDPKEKLEK